LGIGDWGLGPIPNPQSPIEVKIIININSMNCMINSNNSN